MLTHIVYISLISMQFAALIYLIRGLRLNGTKLSEIKGQQRETKKSISQLEKSLRRDLLKAQSQLSLLNLLAPGSDYRSWEFVLSLTSHPARFDALAQMLPTLKNQVLQPTKIYLNIAAEDIAALPQSVKDIVATGYVTLNETDDLGPGKKLIPTLALEKKLPIIVIDDDLILSPDLTLKILLQHHLYPSCIIASRVHLVTFNNDGKPLPFSQWEKAYEYEDGPSSELIATSGAGTLFPADSLHPDVADVQAFKELSFHTDDLWWYFQGRRKGTQVRRVPGFRALTFIPDSQEAGLWNTGNKNRNDENLGKLIEKYGVIRGA